MTQRRYATQPSKTPARTGGEDRPAWQDSALCAQSDPDLHFAEVGHVEDTWAAKRLCKGNPKRGIDPCPVVAECLAYALEHGEFGVWGGTTETERRKLKRGAA